MLCNKLTIRKSKVSELTEIKAFDRVNEAKLVEALTNSNEKCYSYVAICDGNIVGHVFLTEIKASVKAVALAPLAVLPKYRELQIGTQLVRHAINAAKKNKYEAMFVLGDVAYYERFGFSGILADPFKIKWQSKNFMALELKENALKKKAGELVYPPAFFNF